MALWQSGFLLQCVISSQFVIDAYLHNEITVEVVCICDYSNTALKEH